MHIPYFNVLVERPTALQHGSMPRIITVRFVTLLHLQFARVDNATLHTVMSYSIHL